jgi:hypothetical protein
MCSLFAYYRRCSLRFDIEENTIIEAFLRFRFASVAITTQDSTPPLSYQCLFLLLYLSLSCSKLDGG